VILTIPAPCQFINLNSRTHWAPKAKQTKAWRTAAYVAASNAKLPKGLSRVHIVAHVVKPTSRAYDVHNLLPTLKAAIDGLVDYGLIQDDSNEYLVGPDLRQGGKGESAIVITIAKIGDLE
jgi:crossover junction endodeoxyribonuclease RusA